MKKSLLEVTNDFLLTKKKGPVQSKTDDLFDYMDSLDFLEFILYLEQQNIKVLIPIRGTHFNFNLVETVERLERYIEEKEAIKTPLLTLVNQFLELNGKSPVEETTKIFSSGLVDFQELVAYLEMEASIILPTEYETKLDEIDTVEIMKKVVK